MNYDKEMQSIINNLDYVPKLLLHSCCAPCSSSVIERLAPFFDITVLYYNPNIEPISEYEKRKEEQKLFLTKLKTPHLVTFLDADYDNDDFHRMVKGLEECKERGLRCYKCYEKRLKYTASQGAKGGYDYFCSTLTLSPYKVSAWVNEIGKNLESIYKIKFLVSDFKKREGYKRSIELSQKYNLYRQNYCGCVYSKQNKLMQSQPK